MKLLNLYFLYFADIPKQFRPSSSLSNDHIIKNIISKQHDNCISSKNENNNTNINNIKRTVKNDTIDNNVQISLKFIDDNISNFIPRKTDLSILDKDLIERKQRVKRRKLNLSTVDYTAEKFVDISSCSKNYFKIRLQKNKRHSINKRIIGFINNNTEGNKSIDINDNANFDKYDQFWIIKDNKHLIIGSWKRYNILFFFFFIYLFVLFFYIFS